MEQRKAMLNDEVQIVVKEATPGIKALLGLSVPRAGEVLLQAKASPSGFS